MTSLDVSGLYPDLKVITTIRDDYIHVALKPVDETGRYLGSLTAIINLIGDNPAKYLNSEGSLGEVSLLFFDKRSSGPGMYSADVGSIQEIKKALDLFWEEIEKAIEIAWNDKNSGKGWVE